MSINRKPFRIGTVFESNTEYYAEQDEYHIYPENAIPAIDCWYTTATGHDEPLLSAFVMRDLENVTVDLGGAMLMFHGRIQCFALFDCRNITLKNFSIDYDRPFYTQGSVVDSEKGSFTLKIPDVFRYRVADGDFIAEGENWERSLNFGAPLFQTYDAATMGLSSTTPMILAVVGKKTDPQENPPCPIYELLAEDLGENRVRFTGTPDFFVPHVGEIIAFTHENRHKNGFHFECCEDLVCENIRLLHISAMAVLANLCHNLTFRNFSCFADERTGERIITVNADILHGFHCTGTVLVENCRFENMLDDALNFHGNYMICEAQADGHTLRLINKSAGMGHMPMYLPGDTIRVYRGSTQEFRADYTVVSSEYMPGPENRLLVKVAEPVSDFNAGDIVESQRMPEIIIRSCNAGHARGGYRISSGKRVLMENCVFENTPIMFTGDTNYWYENTPVRDVTIRDSRFVYYPGGDPIVSVPIFTPTDKVRYYHSGIRILNNRFTDCRKGLMYMRQTDGVEFAGNTVDKDCDPTIRVEACDHVSIKE